MSFRNRAHGQDESHRPAASGASGFTLLETTIAMVVMMVVGLGASSLFLYAVRNNAGGESRSQALAIAQQRLEALRAVPFNDPQLALGQTVSTVVLEDVEAGGAPAAAAAAQNYSGGAQAYSAGGGGVSTPSAKPGKDPTPTPTPVGGGGSGGGGGGTGAGDDEYQVVLDIEGYPAGSATPTRKVIKVTVTPVNGYGANSWINANPVVITIHRSSTSNGPYRLSS